MEESTEKKYMEESRENKIHKMGRHALFLDWETENNKDEFSSKFIYKFRAICTKIPAKCLIDMIKLL